MFKKIVVVSSVAAALGVVAMSAPVQAGNEPTDWVLENCVDTNGNPTTKITSGAACDLKNKKNGKCLVRDSHMGQTDWDFASCSAKPRQAKFVAQNPGAISCGETVALKLGSEFFRKCKDPQKMGINICSDGGDSPKPMHYDWQLSGCSGDVESGEAVALYNVSRGDSVVFAKRPSKMVDTCWNDKMKLGQCTTARDK